MNQGTCQHPIVYTDLPVVSVKSHNREGGRAVAHSVLCEACYRLALAAGQVLETEDAEWAWMMSDDEESEWAGIGKELAG